MNSTNSKQHPTALPPKELRNRRQWVAYRLEPKPGQPDKFNKMPYYTPSRRAKHGDKKTWLKYSAACALSRTDGFAGVGFVFSARDKYVGIDLDSCRNPKTGDTVKWAARIIKRMASYTELSQSGKGFHVIVKGKLREGIRHRLDKLTDTTGGKEAKLEVYDRVRFFVMTGQVYRKHGTIRQKQQALNALITQYLTPVVPGTTVDLPIRNPDLLYQDIVARTEASNPAEFHRLYDAGETRPGKSPSESDYQLACMFAHVVGGDVERIERLMRQSALVRDKWDVHPTYLTERTIARAINAEARNHPAGISDDAERQTYFPSLRLILDNPELMHRPPALIRCVAWTGRVSLLAGREKQSGKSTFLSAAVSRVTRGKPFLDAPTSDKPGKVLWVSADEEHTADIATRLKFFHAHPDRVALLYPTGALPERLAEIEARIEEFSPVLVIVDTLSSFARVQDPFSSKEWPEVILSLKRNARERNLAMVLVHHTTKNANEEYRDSTSIGATVDQLVTLASVEKSTPTHRRLKSMGRLSGSDEAWVNLDGNIYHVVANPMASLADRIRLHLNENPDASQRAIEEAAGGDNKLVRKTLLSLEKSGQITWVPGDRGAHMYSLAKVSE